MYSKTLSVAEQIKHNVYRGTLLFSLLFRQDLWNQFDLYDLYELY